MFLKKTVGLRSLEESDLEKLKKWRNLPHVNKTTREYKLLNMINQKKWFEKIHDDNPPIHIMFGIQNKNNELTGVCGLTYIDWKNRHSELSIYLAKKNWQESQQAKETIQIMLDYGFGEINLHRIYVEIFEIATENIKLFKKIKFKREAVLRDKLWRDGRWWNSQIYSIISSEYKNAKKN